MKLVATVAVGVAALLVFILIVMKQDACFETASKMIAFVLITCGAIIASLLLSPEKLAIVFKIFVILFFSLLPGWLYWQFIRTKGKTLEDEYVLNLHRLHIDNDDNLPEPPRRSIFYSRWYDAQGEKSGEESIYEKKYQALFGTSDSTLSLAALRSENVWPVAVATVIISVGWILVVKPGAVSTMPDLTSSPDSSPIPFAPFCFAFLGAYFYIMQMLVRRYFQNDLKTAAYINATMRIVIVILLVWVVDLLLQQQAVKVDIASRKAVAFVIGVFPYVGWQALQALIKLPFKYAVPALRQKHPLSDLDGLNIWYESRLLEEGIEDMQNLATANLVEVILNTRIPVDRLIDWVDQSLLYLHLGKGDEKDDSVRGKLRRFGIRTATDLDEALNSEDTELVGRLKYLLNEDKKKEPSILRCIQATFKDEPNLYHVRQWKGFADRALKPETDALEKAQSAAQKGD